MTTETIIWSLAVVAFVVSVLGVAQMRRWGARRLLDIPNARSSHSRPTPRGGGLPLVVAALAAWIVFLYLTGARRWDENLALVVGATLVAGVSWLDDLKGLPFRVRLSVHLCAAAIVLWTSPPSAAAQLPGLGAVPLGPLAWPLAFIWIAGLTNAYNFMDGIDGIAGGQGAVAGLAWWFLGWTYLTPTVGVLGLYLGVAAVAFLLFNWAPARIFMGDVGAATLGFLFAAIPFAARPLGPQALTAWVVAAAVTWPFVFDSGFTLVRRWRRGEKVTEAHRSHLYQRLVIAGWGHAATSTLYILWALTTSAAGWTMARGYPWSGPVGLGWAAVSGTLVWWLVVRVEASRMGMATR